MNSTPTTSRPLPPRATPSPASTAALRSGAVRTTSARSSPVNGRPAPPRKAVESVDSPSRQLTGREALEAALRRETEEKELLLLKLEDSQKAAAQQADVLSSLRSSVALAESRLAQLSADALRTDHTLSEQGEIITALRTQLAALERERRDEERRYREQAGAFDAERQAAWEGEQLWRARVERLEERARRAEARADVLPSPAATVSLDNGLTEEEEAVTPRIPHPPKVDEQAQEPPEMTMMRLEMDSLAGAYASLQNTHQILQQELADLKRVNQQIQEENESYNVLLRERTLAGTFHLPASSPYSDTISLDEDVYSRASGPRPLDTVSEDAEVFESESFDIFPAVPAPARERERDTESPVPSLRSQGRTRPDRRRRTSAGSGKGVGESLAGFPVSGPGEDLAAELGRAEARDGVPEVQVLEPPQTAKKEEPGTVASMRAEIHALRDANKALSLYAAKILDRIIAEEGFEHVLAADYKEGPTNAGPGPASRPERGASLSRSKTVAGHGKRPVSSANATLSTIRDQPQEQIPVAPLMLAGSKSDPPSVVLANQQQKRRSMSIDWKGLFGGGSAPPEKKSDNLRPLSLAGAATPAPPKAQVPAAGPAGPARPRFVSRDTEEDEEDRRERERLNATMKLMGIDRGSSYRDRGLPADDLSHLEMAQQSGALGGPSTSDRRRTAVFRSPSPNLAAAQQQPQQRVSSPFSYSRSPEPEPHAELTSEALAEAGAAHALAELDAQEKHIAEQLARGKALHSGFTPSPREMAEAGEGPNGAGAGTGAGTGLMRRSSRRARTGRESSGTMSVGSVSTVWSAGRASGTGSSAGDVAE